MLLCHASPRHEPGTRLLVIHEGACVDAQVEPWPGTSLDVKEGSRHYLRVEGKLLSGWATFSSPEGVPNFAKNEKEEEEATDAASALTDPTATASTPDLKRRSSVLPAVVEATNEDDADADAAAVDEEGPMEGIFTPIRKKIAVHSGCDPTSSERVGALSEKTPVRILQQRKTELGLRVYVSTIPSKSNVLLTMALNEFNHSPQRFPSVAEYEAARVNYCEDIVVREALVEDAITGNQLRIKDQTLHISTATDAVDNARPIPAEWHVHNVLDLVRLLLVPSPNRANGCHSQQPVLVRAGPGTGKTWMAKQAVFTLADRLLRGTTGGNVDGIQLVPIVVFVQRIIYLLREDVKKDGSALSLLERYIQSVYSGKKYESWCEMLMQAYDMRALVVLLDGVDEAAGLRDQIEMFVHKEVVPSGNRVLVTSRPEGVRLETYSKTFVVMNLNQLTNEQQRAVINVQMQGNVFFDHLLSLGEVRKKLDDAYRKIGAMVRNDLETLWGSNLWQNLVDGVPVYDPEMRQKDVSGQRFVAEVTSLSSEFLVNLEAGLKDTDNEAGISLLVQADAACAKYTTYDEGTFEEEVLASMVGEEDELYEHGVAVKLAACLKKMQQAAAEAEAAERAAGGAKAGKSIRAKAEALPKGGKAGDKVAAGDTEADTEEASQDTAQGLWNIISRRTDEIYIVHEAMEQVYTDVMTKLVTEAAKTDEEAKALLNDIEWAVMKDPVRLHEKAHEQCATRFNDKVVCESCISDVTRARVSLHTGAQVKDLVNRLAAGLQLTAEQLMPVQPSQKAAQEEAEEAAAAAGTINSAPISVEVNLMHLDNKFDILDPTHFRYATCQLQIIHKGKSIFVEIEIHFAEILAIGMASNSAALEHYDFFRKRLKGTVPEAELKRAQSQQSTPTGSPAILSEELSPSHVCRSPRDCT